MISASQARSARFVSVGTVQATVETFDPVSHAATVLRDDGTRVDVPPAAFEASGLRLLRLGQRVRLECDPDRRVVRIALVTM